MVGTLLISCCAEVGMFLRYRNSLIKEKKGEDKADTVLTIDLSPASNLTLMSSSSSPLSSVPK